MFPHWYLDIVRGLVPGVLAAVSRRDMRDLAPLPVAVGLAPELHVFALLDRDVLWRGGGDLEGVDHDGGGTQGGQQDGDSA